MKIQGLLGVVLGIVLFSMVYDHVEMRWFVYLAAFQAASVAVGEFIVAHSTSVEHGAKWCYASASIATVSCLALLFGGALGPRELAWLLYGYLGAFGLNLCVLSARMLFAERSLSHGIHRQGVH